MKQNAPLEGDNFRLINIPLILWNLNFVVLITFFLP
jgi:hypothetical protein